jgi:hypothetical protein
MKRVLLVGLIISILSTRGFCSDNPTSIDNSNYFPASYKNISADATTTAVGVSMIGWGVGLAAVVATLAILIPPDEESNSHSHCDSN